jgi:hypothetical protein
MCFYYHLLVTVSDGCFEDFLHHYTKTLERGRCKTQLDEHSSLLTLVLTASITSYHTISHHITSYHISLYRTYPPLFNPLLHSKYVHMTLCTVYPLSRWHVAMILSFLDILDMHSYTFFFIVNNDISRVVFCNQTLFIVCPSVRSFFSYSSYLQ